MMKRVLLAALIACSPTWPVGVSSCKVPPSLAIDAGHSPRNPGATSARGVSEYAFNRRLAEELAATLAARGRVRPLLLANASENLSLAERPRRAAELKGSMLLSIHHDSVQPRYLTPWSWRGRSLRFTERARGFSLFVSRSGARAADSMRLATALADALLASRLKPSLHHAEPIPGENRELVDARRGIYVFDQLAVLRLASMPAVLVECGVITNRDEEVELQDPTRRHVLVQALAQGIEDFLGDKRSAAQQGVTLTGSQVPRPAPQG